MAIDIARAWKDPEYRKTLTPDEVASLPPNPAGDGEMSEKELDGVSGGVADSLVCTVNTVCPLRER